jgi:hypothetical protein
MLLSNNIVKLTIPVTATVSPAHLVSKERRDLMMKMKMEVMMRIANASINPSVFREQLEEEYDPDSKRR